MQDIIQRARDLGLCDEWYKAMKQEPTMKHFCEMYFKGDDWAKENDFPSLDLLRKYKAQTEEYGLMTDYIGQLANWSKIAFFGESNAEINYDGFTVAQIIVRHDSKLKIRAKNHAMVYVDVLDNAQVETEIMDNARIKIYKK